MEDNIDINPKKVKNMLNQIYKVEKENAKTNKYTDKEIRIIIQNIIENEVKKCY